MIRNLCAKLVFILLTRNMLINRPEGPRVIDNAFIALFAVGHGQCLSMAQNCNEQTSCKLKTDPTVICRNKTPLAADIVRKGVLFPHFPAFEGYQFLAKYYR